MMQNLREAYLSIEDLLDKYIFQLLIQWEDCWEKKQRNEKRQFCHTILFQQAFFQIKTGLLYSRWEKASRHESERYSDP